MKRLLFGTLEMCYTVMTGNKVCPFSPYLLILIEEKCVSFEV
jgi:hypothetical protein